MVAYGRALAVGPDQQVERLGTTIGQRDLGSLCGMLYALDRRSCQIQLFWKQLSKAVIEKIPGHLHLRSMFAADHLAASVEDDALVGPDAELCHVRTSDLVKNARDLLLHDQPGASPGKPVASALHHCDLVSLPMEQDSGE